MSSVLRAGIGKEEALVVEAHRHAKGEPSQLADETARPEVHRHTKGEPRQIAELPTHPLLTPPLDVRHAAAVKLGASSTRKGQVAPARARVR